jgi:cytochrome c oxidase subunit IV
MSDTRGTEDVTKRVRTYVAVFVALIVLTMATVGASHLHLVIPAAIAVALLIAVMKGSMVASVFMHLVGEQKAIYWALLLTLVLLVALLFLPVLGYLDRVR